MGFWQEFSSAFKSSYNSEELDEKFRYQRQINSHYKSVRDLDAERNAALNEKISNASDSELINMLRRKSTSTEEKQLAKQELKERNYYSDKENHCLNRH